MEAAQSQVMVLQMRRSCEANTRDQLSGLSIGKKDLAVRPKAKGMRGGLIVEMKSYASRAKKSICDLGFQLDKIEVGVLSTIISG